MTTTRTARRTALAQTLGGVALLVAGLSTQAAPAADDLPKARSASSTSPTHAASKGKPSKADPGADDPDPTHPDTQPIRKDPPP